MNKPSDQIVPRIVPLSALRDNYIWLVCEGSSCIVVDPGESDPVERYLAEHALQLKAVFLTHRHADHQAGVSELLQHRAMDVFGPDCPAMPLVTHTLQGGETISIEGFEQTIQVLSTPGHTPEHLSFLYRGALFCGDTLFSGGCGRLMGGTAEQLFASLTSIAQLPDATLICCAHEYTLSNLRFAASAEPDNPHIQERIEQVTHLRAQGLPSLPSSLREELASNPFLRCEQHSIRMSAQQHAGHALHGPLEVFTRLRQWKDVF